MFIFVILFQLMSFPLIASEPSLVSNDLYPYNGKKPHFSSSPRNRKEAEEIILPFLTMNNDQVSHAARDFFNLLFDQENIKASKSLTVETWNIFIEQIYEKTADEQLCTLNRLYLFHQRNLGRDKLHAAKDIIDDYIPDSNH